MPAPAKRGLFNRPKWAATTAKADAQPAPNVVEHENEEDFFSRSNETFAAIAAEEEERKRRKQVRRAAGATAGSAAADKEPGTKRRRVSVEEHIILSSDASESELSGEEAEEKSAGDTTPRDHSDPKKREPPTALDKGKAVVREAIESPELTRRVVTPPTPMSPSKLPSDVPQIPSDEQCDQIRAKRPSLAPLDNARIRQLALRRWEREHERRTASPVPSSPSKQLRLSPRNMPALRSQVITEKEVHSPGKKGLSCAGQNKASAIALDDDSGPEDKPPPTPTRAAPASKPVAAPKASIEIADESDEEFAELERRAREKARRRRLLEEQPILSPPPDPSSDLPKSATTRSISHDPAPQEVDAQVQLLVTSNLEDARALIITRTISQRFKEVREYWCNTNQLPLDVKSKVVLMWKKRRLYDSQTCKSLGFTADDNGKAVYRNNGDDYAADSFYDDYEGKIHLIAFVEGMGPKQVPSNGASTAAAASASGTVSQGAGNAQDDPGVDPAKSEQPIAEIRIIVRAKGFPDCKLMVKPTTVIQRIIRAFRANGKVPDGKNVALMFDGELLQPNATVGQTEIEDMEYVDAYVR